MIAALDNMGGTSANVINEITGHANADTRGGVLGDDVHELVTAELPSHVHGSVVTGSSLGDPYQISGNNSNPRPITSVTTGNTGAQGSGNKHANMQPTMFMNYIIKT